MSSSDQVHLSEKHEFGAQTKYDMVRCSTEDPRLWLQGAPVCPNLMSHHISHVGIMYARYGLEVARPHQSGSYFIATLSGSGEILVDGEWARIQAGQACILPARYPNAHRAINRNDTWSYCWVRYVEPLESMPITSATRPVMRAYDADAIAHAIEGLRHAALQDGAAHLLQYWVELIHGYVEAFEDPAPTDERLRRAWTEIHASLARPWNVESMSELANMSSEHFRRLCLAHLERTPAKHLTYLRLQEAVQRLHTTNDTIDAIASRVGYQSASALSKAIYKWTGFRPGMIRQQATNAQGQ